MAKFKFAPLLLDGVEITARTADGTSKSEQLGVPDKGKFVKLVGDSQYGLCADGDAIEGTLLAADYPAPQDGYNLGTVQRGGRVRVKFGEQLNVGDFVVCGSVAARGTALTEPPTVKKESSPGAFRWRVVSLDGTNAVGQTGLIEAI